MIGIFKECALTLVENFREAAKKGQDIDAKKYSVLFLTNLFVVKMFFFLLIEQ